jgi:hypothetical protein
VGESSDGRQALPGIGPRGQAVIDQLLAAVTELEFCEHGREDFALWIAARPGMVLCDFCYQTAQVLPQTSGARRAGSQPGIRARTRWWWPGSPWLDAHFSLCSWCAELDLRHARQLG